MRTIALQLLATLVSAGCVVVTAPPAYDVDVAPPLPPVVVLEHEPYYYNRGYYYYYHDDGWRYSRSNRGPWRDLPRSHWPHEVRRGGRWR